MEGKFWCFTWNNYPEDWFEYFRDIEYTFIVGGHEIGEQGTPHIQGYIEFMSNWKLNRLKCINKKIRWARRNGTAVQAAEYCIKEDGSHVWIGDISNPVQGKRNDIVLTRERLRAGGNMRDVINEATSMQSIRFAQEYLKYFESPRNWKTKIYWYYGRTGSGKTRMAYEKTKNRDVWIAGNTGKWWQGYDGQSDIIIDDLRSDFCTFDTMLRICDRYGFTTECKNGSRQLKAKRIYITSPYHPKDVWDNDEDIEQLLRRIYKIKNFGRDEMEVRGNTSPDSCDFFLDL